jgi:hypothetical protein
LVVSAIVTGGEVAALLLVPGLTGDGMGSGFVIG